MDIQKIIERLNNQKWKQHPVLKNVECSEFGMVKVDGKFMKGCLSESRKMLYRTVGINKKAYFVHRLVYECFNGIIPKGLVIDHINTFAWDNRIENLRAVTYAENNANPLTRQHQIKAKREQNGKKVLKLDKKTEEILGFYWSIRQAGTENNICPRYIRWVCDEKPGFYTAGGFKWKYTDCPWTCKWGKWWKTN